VSTGGLLSGPQAHSSHSALPHSRFRSLDMQVMAASDVPDGNWPAACSADFSDG
jgi:hypothetical protein